MCSDVSRVALGRFRVGFQRVLEKKARRVLLISRWRQLPKRQRRHLAQNYHTPGPHAGCLSARLRAPLRPRKETNEQPLWLTWASLFNLGNQTIQVCVRRSLNTQIPPCSGRRSSSSAAIRFAADSQGVGRRIDHASSSSRSR